MFFTSVPKVLELCGVLSALRPISPLELESLDPRPGVPKVTVPSTSVTVRSPCE